MLTYLYLYTRKCGVFTFTKSQDVQIFDNDNRFAPANRRLLKKKETIYV